MQEVKAEVLQKNKPVVTCENLKLKNIFKFKYLGSIFCADGEHIHDVDRRVALAMSRGGELRHVFGHKDQPFSLKLKIYKTAVSSLITYDNETWSLTKETQSRINGVNARCVQRVTDKTVREEASHLTRVMKVIRLYAERPTLSISRTSDGFRLTPRSG